MELNDDEYIGNISDSAQTDSTTNTETSKKKGEEL